MGRVVASQQKQLEQLMNLHQDINANAEPVLACRASMKCRENFPTIVFNRYYTKLCNLNARWSSGGGINHEEVVILVKTVCL